MRRPYYNAYRVAGATSELLSARFGWRLASASTLSPALWRICAPESIACFVSWRILSDLMLMLICSGVLLNEIHPATASTKTIATRRINARMADALQEDALLTSRSSPGWRSIAVQEVYPCYPPRQKMLRRTRGDQ